MPEEAPEHVRPRKAMLRRMRIARAVRFAVMNAVRANPLQRAALPAQRAQRGQRVFNDLRRLETAVRQQAVIAHTNTQPAREIEHHRHQHQTAPVKERGHEGQQCEAVHDRHARDVAPVQAASAFACLNNGDCRR